MNHTMNDAILYHVTTPKKLARYKGTGCILAPVRGWKFENSAREWAKKCNRSIVLKIRVKYAYPLPDHQPRMHGFWADENVHKWEIV